MTILDRSEQLGGDSGGTATVTVAVPPGDRRRPWRRPSAFAVFMLVLLLGLVAGPVAMVFVGALQSDAPGLPGNTFSLDAVYRVYISGEYYGSLFGTLIMAVGVATLSIVFGGLAAWFLTRVNVPFRKVWEFGLILPLFLSPFVGALAWFMLAAPNAGMIKPAMMRIHDALEPRFTTGTIAVRTLPHTYSLASCTACPASWAATPAAATLA